MILADVQLFLIEFSWSLDAGKGTYATKIDINFHDGL